MKFINVLGITFLLLVYVGCDSSTAPSIQEVWTNTNAPIDGYVMALISNSSTIMAGSVQTGACRSSDNGKTWLTINNGLSSQENVRALAFNSTTYFAGTIGNGILRSTDKGMSWAQINSGLTEDHILSLVATDSILFAGTNNGAFRSTNSGTTWTAINDGFPLGEHTVVSCLATAGLSLFAGTGLTPYFYRSTNNGTSWISSSNGLSKNTPVIAIAASGGNVYAITSDSVYHSIDDGNSWTPLNTRITFMPKSSILAIDNNVFLGTGSGVFLSTNEGASWNQENSGLSDTLINMICANENTLFAGTLNGGVWRRPLSSLIKN
jgi:photosystem II stability/assembly factor-like uncharacterized protein